MLTITEEKMKPQTTEQKNEQKEKEDAIRDTKFVIDSAKISAVSLGNIFNGNSLDYQMMLENLEEQTAAVQQNDLRYLEKMLVTQAKMLESVFHKNILGCSKTNLTAHMQIYMDIAFRAQNLCRKTIIALANIKNPKHPTFIKNQNNAINQQINQSQEEKLKNFSQKCSNELLSEVPHETLDTGRESPPSKADSLVEAVGKGGSQNSKRESSEPNERL
jgi:hypothetical protein